MLKGLASRYLGKADDHAAVLDGQMSLSGQPIVQAFGILHRMCKALEAFPPDI
jgi:hypothetical protein